MVQHGSFALQFINQILIPSLTYFAISPFCTFEDRFGLDGDQWTAVFRCRAESFQIFGALRARTANEPAVGFLPAWLYDTLLSRMMHAEEQMQW